VLIGLTGRAQAGKDTCCERLAILGAERGIEVERRSFADKLYESAAYSINVPPEALRTLKTMPTALLTLEMPLPEDDPRAPGQVIVSQLTVREYLQMFGTEGHRNTFGDTFWVDAAGVEEPGEGHALVFTDVRFDNEAAAIREAGGLIVRVIGTAEVEAEPIKHASEEGVQPIDATVVNDVHTDGFAGLDRQLRAILTIAAGDAE